MPLPRFPGGLHLQVQFLSFLRFQLSPCVPWDMRNGTDPEGVGAGTLPLKGSRFCTGILGGVEESGISSTPGFVIGIHAHVITIYHFN